MKHLFFDFLHPGTIYVDTFVNISLLKSISYSTKSIFESGQAYPIEEDCEWPWTATCPMHYEC